MAIKDGCNNMEKNKILRYHDAGEEPANIAKALRLTERIVISIIEFYRKGGKETQVVQSKAKEEFDEDFD